MIHVHNYVGLHIATVFVRRNRLTDQSKHEMPVQNADTDALQMLAVAAPAPSQHLIFSL